MVSPFEFLEFDEKQLKESNHIRLIDFSSYNYLLEHFKVLY